MSDLKTEKKGGDVAGTVQQAEAAARDKIREQQRETEEARAAEARLEEELQRAQAEEAEQKRVKQEAEEKEQKIRQITEK